jgi:hypothetical protein
MNLLTSPTIVPLLHNSLDDLWEEAETLGHVRVWTVTNYAETQRTGYNVTLIGRRKSTKLEVQRNHTSLACALADCINEAREMGLGES